MSRREPGYRPEPKLYRMEFDDHPGLVARARSTSAGAFLRISSLSDTTNKNNPDEVQELFKEFAMVLVSWNLEHCEDGPLGANGEPEYLVGDPVPTTLEGLLTQDLFLVLDMIEGWMQAVAGVPAPLAQPSSDGSPSLVESLPMEPLLLNQAN